MGFAVLVCRAVLHPITRFLRYLRVLTGASRSGGVVPAHSGEHEDGGGSCQHHSANQAADQGSTPATGAAVGVGEVDQSELPSST